MLRGLWFESWLSGVMVFGFEDWGRVKNDDAWLVGEFFKGGG